MADPTPPDLSQQQARPQSPAVFLNTVAGLPPPASESNLGDDGGAALYLGWGRTTHYVWDYGLRGQPPAAPSGAALVDFARLHAGSCVKTVTVVATRLGAKPALPSQTIVAAGSRRKASGRDDYPAPRLRLLGKVAKSCARASPASAMMVRWAAWARNPHGWEGGHDPGTRLCSRPRLGR